MKRVVLAVLLGLLATSALSAADLTGIWVGQIETRQGQKQDIAFKLVQKGTTISGKLYGDYQSTPIIEGSLTDDQVSFVVVTPEQAGNQINESRLRFSGAFKDGELELTRERESSVNAGNSGGAQIRNNTKQTFKLKRLI
jgi:hypothetical protein